MIKMTLFMKSFFSLTVAGFDTTSLAQYHGLFQTGMIACGVAAAILLMWEIIGQVSSKKILNEQVQVNIVEDTEVPSTTEGAGDDPIKSLLQAQAQKSEADESVLPSFLDEELDITQEKPKEAPSAFAASAPKLIEPTKAEQESDDPFKKLLQKSTQAEDTALKEPPSPLKAPEVLRIIDRVEDDPFKALLRSTKTEPEVVAKAAPISSEPPREKVREDGEVQSASVGTPSEVKLEKPPQPAVKKKLTLSIPLKIDSDKDSSSSGSLAREKAAPALTPTPMPGRKVLSLDIPVREKKPEEDKFGQDTPEAQAKTSAPPIIKLKIPGKTGELDPAAVTGESVDSSGSVDGGGDNIGSSQG